MDETFVDENMVQEPKKSSKKLKWFLLVGMIVALAVILFFAWQIRKSYGKHSPEKVTEYFLKALKEQDADEMYRLLNPDYISYMEDAGSIFGMNPKSDVSDQMDFFFEDLRDYYGIGLYKTLFYEDEDIEMQKYSGADLTEMQEYFREEFEMEIDAFTQANITLSVEGTKGKETVSIELFLFQVGKKWYYIDWYWD